MEGKALGPREEHYLNHEEHMKKPMNTCPPGTLDLMKNIQLRKSRT